MSSPKRILIRWIAAIQQRVKLGSIRSIVLSSREVTLAVVYQDYGSILISTGHPDEIYVTVTINIVRDQRTLIDACCGEAEFGSTQVREFDSNYLVETI